MIRVYRYQCRAPRCGEHEAIQQIRLANGLWNALVAAEREHRQRVEQVLAELAPGSELAARPQVDEAAMEAWKVKKYRLQAQRAHLPALEYRERMRALRAARPRRDQEALAAWKARRKAAFQDETVRARLAELQQEFVASQKTAYREFSERGLWWGNSDAVLAHFRTAQRGAEGLRFHPTANEGTLAVRYQLGLPVERALAGNDTRFQLVPNDEAGNQQRILKRGGARMIARVRVGSTGRRHDPVWLELPVLIDRPLPADGVIRQVLVVRQDAHGTHTDWRLNVVVDDGREVTLPEQAERIVAIDIGWRLLDDGRLRVAVWADSAGNAGELALDADWLWRWQKVRDLRAIRDKRFDAIRAELLAWLAEHQEEVPDWLRQATRNLERWRSCERLASVVWRWKDQRFDGDEGIYQEMEAWRRRDRHLREWQVHQAAKLQRQRLERYRRFANSLYRYDEVRVEQFDLRRVAARSEHGGHQEDLTPEARWMRVLAACYQLRLQIENVCRREGLRYQKRDAALTTQRCHVCGQVERFNAASREELVHTCSHCAATWDQDLNAALNLLSQTPTDSEQAGGLRCGDAA